MKKDIVIKKAFTLTELAIVLTIIAIVLGAFLNLGTAALDKTKVSSTKDDLEVIKTALISYAAKHGRLPYPDTDGNGYENDGSDEESGDTNAADCTTDDCELPYVDLRVKAKDVFGQEFKYDVWHELLNTDRETFCHSLQNYYTEDVKPQVVNDDHDTPNEKVYSVAAVIISKGEDKELSGENKLEVSTPYNRIYEMAQNKYHDTDNNDLVAEISVFEILGSVCDLVPENSSNTVVSASLNSNTSDDLDGGVVTGGVAFETDGTLNYTTYNGTGNQYITYNVGKTYARFTVSMWMKPTDWNTNTRQFFWTAETDEIRLELANGNIIYRPAPTGVGGFMNAALGLDGSSWHHITFTQRRTSTTNVEAKFYLDGQLVSSVSGDWEDLDNTFYLGSWAGRGSDGLNGSIDDLKFYDYDLLQSDIESYFDETKADYGF